MSYRRAFISFDFGNDDDLRNALVGQAKYPNSPFEIVDASVRKHLSGNWKEKVRKRIQKVDLVIAICGEHTRKAKGVAAEVRLAREEGKPYFLLRGHSDRVCTKPTTARSDDEMHDWTWDNLRKLIEGKTLTEFVEEFMNSPATWLAVGGIGLALWMRSRNKRFCSDQPWQLLGTGHGRTRLGFSKYWHGGY